MFDKSKFVTENGIPYTQSLFLELGYSEQAIYTLKDNDHEWNGNIYLSIKRLYLEMEDPTEYEFANTYFLNWKQWQRITENKLMKDFVANLREELEVKLKAKAVKQMMLLANSGSYQAAKWLTDRGWDDRKAGRPTKSEKEKQLAIETNIVNEYNDDVVRLLPQKKVNNG